MAKLGHETKGDFQRSLYSTLVIKYFEGGNAQGRSADIASDISGIVRGLSRAWDEAEESDQDRE